MSVFPSEKVLCETRKAKPARHRLSEPIWVQFLKELFDSATSLFLSSVLRYSLTWTLFCLSFFYLFAWLLLSKVQQLHCVTLKHLITVHIGKLLFIWLDIKDTLMLNNQFKDLKFLKIGLEEIENSKKTQNDVKN